MNTQVNVNCVCVDRYGRQIGFTAEQSRAVKNAEKVSKTAEQSIILDKSENGSNTVKVTDFSEFATVIAVSRGGSILVKYLRLRENLNNRLSDMFDLLHKLAKYPIFDSVKGYTAYGTFNGHYDCY